MFTTAEYQKNKFGSLKFLSLLFLFINYKKLFYVKTF